MEELQKVDRVVRKELGRAPDETLLVLDATTGQNALTQAQEFKEATGLTGVVLTKLDGTAKGGTIITIAEEMRPPHQADRCRREGGGPGGLRPAGIRGMAAPVGGMRPAPGYWPSASSSSISSSSFRSSEVSWAAVEQIRPQGAGEPQGFPSPPAPHLLVMTGEEYVGNLGAA